MRLSAQGRQIREPTIPGIPHPDETPAKTNLPFERTKVNEILPKTNRSPKACARVLRFANATRLSELYSS
jgi:hypothetical protein